MNTLFSRYPLPPPSYVSPFLFPPQYNSNHRDLNAKGAWEQGFTGKGVVVSILDDGIEKNHPDLKQNYVSRPSLQARLSTCDVRVLTLCVCAQDPDASYDVNDGDPDPQPRYTQLNDNR